MKRTLKRGSVNRIRNAERKRLPAKWKAEGYKSGSEGKIADQLSASNVKFRYEALKVPYVKHHTYNPDFLLPNGIILEVKGYWDTADRAKIKLVHEQNPDLDIRMVFDNADARCTKASKTTYGGWCDKRGIKYTVGSVPISWLREAPNESSLTAIKALQGNS